MGKKRVKVDKHTRQVNGKAVTVGGHSREVDVPDSLTASVPVDGTSASVVPPFGPDGYVIVNSVKAPEGTPLHHFETTGELPEPDDVQVADDGFVHTMWTVKEDVDVEGRTVKVVADLETGWDEDSKDHVAVLKSGTYVDGELDERSVHGVRVIDGGRRSSNSKASAERFRENTLKGAMPPLLQSSDYGRHVFAGEPSEADTCRHTEHQMGGLGRSFLTDTSRGLWTHCSVEGRERQADLDRAIAESR